MSRAPLLYDMNNDLLHIPLKLACRKREMFVDYSHDRATQDNNNSPNKAARQSFPSMLKQISSSSLSGRFLPEIFGSSNISWRVLSMGGLRIVSTVGPNFVTRPLLCRSSNSLDYLSSLDSGLLQLTPSTHFLS